VARERKGAGEGKGQKYLEKENSWRKKVAGNILVDEM
jgi:hypothetical protein